MTNQDIVVYFKTTKVLTHVMTTKNWQRRELINKIVKEK